MPNIELEIGRMIFIKLAIKISKLHVLLKLRILKMSVKVVFVSFIYRPWKEEYLNASVLQEYVVTLFKMGEAKRPIATSFLILQT